MDEDVLRKPIIDESAVEEIFDISEIGEDIEKMLEAITNQFNQVDIKYQALLKTRKHHLNGY
jgi:hypothetical protein